jgi:hypothetical protein
MMMRMMNKPCSIFFLWLKFYTFVIIISIIIQILNIKLFLLGPKKTLIERLCYYKKFCFLKLIFLFDVVNIVNYFNVFL